MTTRVATDVGGTFTDLVYIAEGEVKAVKSDTTPPNFEQGVVNAVDKSGLAPASIDFFAHGSTVVINAITERKGVKTGLITTRGFRDVLEIARGNTPDIFNTYYRKPPPFVPRYLRREVTERLSFQGEVLTPLALNELNEILEDFLNEGVEAVGVCLLHAYQNPVHEQAVIAEIKRLWPELPAIASHQISREWREYERTSTTALSAYVLPPAQAYLDRLKTQLATKGLRSDPFIMQSNGGISTLQGARNNPITLVESGPVGGILGAAAYGQLIGEPDLMALDIGGTTAKCALIENGQARITTEYVIEKDATSAGYPIKTPVIDIVEIGNGGGSVAWVDPAGSLHVGPQSAGSSPGPVAYGRGGTEPTTTDANLLTGRINPDCFAGGEIEPDMAAVSAAFGRVGAALDATPMATAHGVLQIANANMVNALKLISVNRGHDPRDFSLIAFGGGGAMHAVELAAELSIPKVIIPPFAGVFSAWGMLMLDLRRDYIQTRQLHLTADSVPVLRDAFTELVAGAEAEYRDDGFSPQQLRHELYIDARYNGQEHTVKIRLGELVKLASGQLAAIHEQFHRAHEQEYTFRLDSAIEVVNLHLVSFGELDKPELAELPLSPVVEINGAVVGEREVDFDVAGVHTAIIVDREKLLPGMVLHGPAIIEESTTTTVVTPGCRVEIDRYGGLHIHLPEAGDKEDSK